MSEARRVLPWVWTGRIGTAGVAMLVVGYNPAGDAGDIFFVAMVVVLLTLIAALGSLITTRQPGNRIAWLLYTTSAALLVTSATSPVAEAIQPLLSPNFWDYTAVVVFNVVSNVLLYPVLLILFIFPTGRFLTRRWTWAGWVAGVFTIAMLLVAIFSEEVGKIYDPNDELWSLANPIGFVGPEMGEFMVSLSVGVMMWLAVGGVVAMVVRYRRSDSLVRTQIKWVVYAAAIAAASLFSIAFSGGDETLYLIQVLTALAVIPVAITIAITRYKLFEIDRIISRTISYTIVVGLLVAGFFGLITLITSLLPTQNSLAVAGSTLAVAALFNPLRRRVQRAIDRRFNRSRYHATLVSDQFAAQLSQPHTVAELAELWKQTVSDSLQPQASGIWLSR